MTPPHILILAAGQGKRMKSSLPKVLHPLLFRPMIHHLLDKIIPIPHRSLMLVVGHGEEEVRKHCEAYPDVEFLTQKIQRGTADAVMTAQSKLKNEKGSLLVLSGDVVLLSQKTLTELLEEQEHSKASATLLTAMIPSPYGYGRILREQDKIVGIREETDCSEDEKKILEINSGVYVFDIPKLFEALTQIETSNRQGEYYLTDVIELFATKGAKMAAKKLDDPKEILGINDRKALGEVERTLRDQTLDRLMQEGVTFREPSTTWIDTQSKIGPDVLIEGGCVIVESEIAANTTIESQSRILKSKIGLGTTIKQGSYIESSKVGCQCIIGPYAHLRSGTHLADAVKIGNFVELKNSHLANGVKASHLSYIGDAEIGENTNIGCGFITCNYDGKSKHRTTIGANVFVGSDSQTVAPVTIGDGSYIASGTTLTEDVPPDSLALSRGRQVTKPGYGKRYRSGEK